MSLLPAAPSIVQLLDYALRYGASVIIALYLVWTLTTTNASDHAVLQQQNRETIQRLDNIERALGRINDRLRILAD